MGTELHCMESGRLQVRFMLSVLKCSQCGVLYNPECIAFTCDSSAFTVIIIIVELINLYGTLGKDYKVPQKR